MSTTVCAEQLQRFHYSQEKSHHFHNIDVPPRKQLLSKRSSRNYVAQCTEDKFNNPSPKFGEEAMFRKFLPSSYDDDEDNPYSADHFRMFEFKIRRCTRSRSHDWTDCPFAHPGEKARRRDPRRFAYSGTVCPEFRRGECLKGDTCEFAHGVFECWLHPARYRTEACKDGKSCKRKVCFFAHTPKQLRVLPPDELMDDSTISRKGGRKSSHSSASGCGHCCVLCLHHQNCVNNNNYNQDSPTSTLPPLSPIKNLEGFSPISRFSGIHNDSMASLSYDEALAELVASLDVMNFSDDQNITNAHAVEHSDYYPWMDQSTGFRDLNELYQIQSPHQENTQFHVLPSSPQQNLCNIIRSGRSNLFDSPNSSSSASPAISSYNWSAPFAGSSSATDDAPDIAWVNELLM